MRLDHVVYAAEPDGLDATAARLGALLGCDLVDGGLHPRFGTRNRVLPLAGGHYLEVVDVLDHPAADKAPFGQAVKVRTEDGGGWLGWVVAVDDLAPIEERLGREAVPGQRHRPDGYELRWRQIGVKGLLSDPQLPFFVHWESDPAEHPSKGATGEVDLAALEIAGDPERLAHWLGGPVGRGSAPLDDVQVRWTAPHGTPGLQSVTFATPGGPVRI
jgi:hypothetical protein